MRRALQRLIIAIVAAALLLLMPPLQPNTRPLTFAKDQSRVPVEILTSTLEIDQ